MHSALIIIILENPCNDNDLLILRHIYKKTPKTLPMFLFKEYTKLPIQ